MAGSAFQVVDCIAVRLMEQPAPIGLPTFRHEPDDFGNSFIRFDAGATKVVQAPQHVVVPEGRKREPRPLGVDHLTG
jgi:hypothetical protein